MSRVSDTENREVSVESIDAKRMPKGVRALTWRSALIGIIGITLLCSVTPYNDCKLHQTYMYGNHFPLGCLFLFTLLVLFGNSFIRWIKPAWVLRQPELLAIWSMLITGSGLASSGLMRYLAPIPLAPFYYGNDFNRWTVWNKFIPNWLVPSKNGQDPVIKWFFEGVPQGQQAPWHPWVHVFLVWGLLFLMLVGLSIFVSALARRQWVERERLTFPLVHIPLEMTREPESGLVNSFFRNKLMWAGCLFTIVFHTINGLHAYFYQVPEIPRVFDLGPIMQMRPWNGFGFAQLEIFFSVIGMAFLVPTDVSFGLWFFYLLFGAVRIMRVRFGMEAYSAIPPNHEVAMSIGGFVVWGIWLAWVARKHLAAIFKSVVGRGERVEDSDEPVPLRLAAVGALLCFVGMNIWTIAAGVSPSLSLVIWTLFTVMLLILTRIIAESGLLFVHTPFISSDFVNAIPGTKMYSAMSVGTGMMLQTILMHDPRESLMPQVLNVMRLKGERSAGRDLIVAVLLAVVVGYSVSFVSFLTTAYKFGSINMDAWGTWNAPLKFYGPITGFLDAPTKTNWAGVGNIIGGGLIVAFLLMMRANFSWWTLHPIGFLMAGTYSMTHIWFSVFIAWLLKSLVLRYGGLRLFRNVLPFFLGMVIGEGIVGGIWLIVGLITKVGTPWFMPS